MGIEFSCRDQTADVITSSTHGRARSQVPGSTGAIGPASPPHRHMRTPSVAFDIEIVFLQYVVSCIIEIRGVFFDMKFEREDSVFSLPRKYSSLKRKMYLYAKNNALHIYFFSLKMPNIIITDSFAVSLDRSWKTPITRFGEK